MSGSRGIARLRRMTRHEVTFRLRAASRSGVGRLAAAWRQPAWRLQRLGGLIEPLGQDVRHAIARLDRGDAAAAHQALRQHFGERESRFPYLAKDLGRIAERVGRLFPSAPAAARQEARAIEQGRFDLLGYEGLDFHVPRPDARGRVDWQWDPVHRRRPPVAWWSRVPYLDPASGDHKIIWELNRHQHFLRLGRAAWLTGDPGCRRTFVTHLNGWLEQNPPRIGVNWASMLELSFRSLSWLWALHFFASPPGGAREEAEEPWIPFLLLGLHAQLEHVRDNLSRYFSPNTHLTGEALGLYVCGRALPELRASGAWADTGRGVLVDQIGPQIARDGGHCERSTHYHRYTLDFYLVALAFARATGDPCADRFAEAADRAATAAVALADSNGRLPLIGDDDGGRLFPVCLREPNDIRDSLALAAVLLNRPDLAVGPLPEEPMWLLGETAAELRGASGTDHGVREESTSTALPDTGYYISRPRRGDHVVFDIGPHGFLNGGHAHADALSIVYTVRGRPVAIDPGTATYTMSPALRDRLRSSQAHNTLTIDGRSQSVPAGPFHWRNAAAARLQAWSSGEGYDYFEGVHDGYRPIVHRRRVVALASGKLVVVDSVHGEGEHQADVYWHLAPAWTPQLGDGNVIALHHEDGGRIAIAVPDADIAVLAGDDDPGLGWHSPVYGRLLPSPTIRLRRRGRLPFTLVSVFADGAATGFAVELIAPLPPREPADEDSIAVQLSAAGRRRELIAFAGRPPLLPGDDVLASPPPPRAVRFAWGDREVVTSARFAWLSWGTEEGIRQHGADGGDVTLDDIRRAAGAA